MKNYDAFSAEAQAAISSFRKRIQVIWDQRILNFIYALGQFRNASYEEDETLYAKYIATLDKQDFKSLFVLVKEIAQYEFFASTDEAMDVACFVRDKNYFLPTVQENEKEKYTNVQTYSAQKILAWSKKS